MSNPVKKTRLHGWHVNHGANMAIFGSYDMPLWYGSAKNEHLAVLETAGIFDTSHMAAVTVTGPDASAAASSAGRQTASRSPSCRAAARSVDWTSA